MRENRLSVMDSLKGIMIFEGKRQSILGYSSSLLYVLASSLARVLIEKMGITISPFLVLFISLLIAFVYFHLINLFAIVDTYKKVLKFKRELLLVNIVTCALWVSFFLGPNYIGADNYTIIAFDVAGMMGAGLWYYQNRTNIVRTSFVIFLYLLALWISLYHIRTSDKHLIGFLLAVLSGISSYIFLKYSAEIQKKSGLTTAATLSLRWWLAMIVATILGYSQISQIPSITPSDALQLLLPAFLGIVIPSFFAQVASVKIGPQVSTVLQSLTPFSTVIFSSLMIGNDIDFISSMASIAIFFAVVIFNWRR